MRTIIIIFIFLFFAVPSFAQEVKVEQWKAIVSQGKKDTTTLIALDSLSIWYGSYNSDSGIYYLVKAKELAKTLNANRYIIKLARTSTIGLFTQGKTAEALKEQYEALHLAEDIKEDSLIAGAYINIGHSHKEYGAYDKALFFYKKARQIGLENNVQGIIQATSLNLGYIYAQINKFDSALYFGQEAYLLAVKKIGNLSSAELYLAEINYKMGKIEVAKAYYQSSYNAFKNLHFSVVSGTRQSVWVLLGFANCSKAIQQKDSALVYAKNALSVAQKIKYLKGIRDAQKLLSELFDDNHQIDSAYRYQKLYISTNDSLTNRDKSSAIESITFEQNLKEQERQKELQKQNDERHHNIQLAITAIAILSFIILFLLLSRSILVSHKVVEFLNVIVLLVVFEFINLIIHPWLEKITHHSPILMLLALVAIAALIVPLHHKLEHWTTKKLVEKNKAIRLAKAKKTIEELEEPTT